MKKRVVVAMSGGVDSSVTAALLKEQGYEVVGMTMQIWDYSQYTDKHGETFGSCCSLDDVYDARRVAEQLDIPFYVINFEQQFKQQVIDRFCDDYLTGLTPNPCVLCNQVLKFEMLMRKARELEAEFLATGHYAQIIVGADGSCALHKGIDGDKDQSYFLFTLTREQMALVRFPLGGMTKEEVRGHAARFNLRVAEKAESQDICFVPDGDYVRFLEEERQLDDCGGPIVHVSGQLIGQHQGYYRYTVGQRKGLGIGWSEPLYVIRIDAANKTVIVGEKQHLLCQEMIVGNCIWSMEPPQRPFATNCRIRYRHHEQPAQVIPLGDGRVKVTFATSQSGVTPGQAAVFYQKDRVLGGGWIQ